MSSVYRRLLWLYPIQHRQQFGEEMFSAFQDVLNEIASAGVLRRGAFLAREFGGLLSGALQEHLRGLGIFDARALLSARRVNMRNGFRFPKSTAILMTIILLGVIVAIRKGEAIAYSLPHVSEPVGPIHPVHSGLLSPIPLFFLCFYAAGVIGWAILFAMRRSGMHRLTEMSGERR